jgi:hypothetical protein
MLSPCPKDPDPMEAPHMPECAIDKPIPHVPLPMDKFKMQLQTCVGDAPVVLSSEFREVQNVECCLDMCLRIAEVKFCSYLRPPVAFRFRRLLG